jgi:hypothetical protein
MFRRKVKKLNSNSFLNFFSIMTPIAYALDVLQGNNVTVGNLVPTLAVIKRNLIELKSERKI